MEEKEEQAESQEKEIPQENEDSAQTENQEPEEGECAEEDAKKEPSAEEQLEALKKENAELKDQLLRRAADFDNYRKRTIKEKQEAFDYGNAALLQDLLESFDNLDRAIQSAESATDAKAVADGVKMISSSLYNMLENKYNLKAFGAAGEEFNPDEHEAIGREEADVESPVIKAVFLKGYKLKDRVIRNAKVMVSMPKESGN